MKKCGTCGRTKPPSDFHVRKASKDGLWAKCKACQSSYDASRIDHPKRVAARAAIAEARRADPDKRAADDTRKRIWAAEHALERRAQVAVGNAVRDRILIKPDVCERCREAYEIEAHHDDYSRPLNVMWLCTTCHGARHRELNAAARISLDPFNFVPLLI